MLVHLLADVEQERGVLLVALDAQRHEALDRLQQLELPVLQLDQALVGVAQVPAEPHGRGRKARGFAHVPTQRRESLRSASFLRVGGEREDALVRLCLRVSTYKNTQTKICKLVLGQ